jgi:hypothetical protein
MADNMSMAPAEPRHKKWGQAEGPLRSQLVPAAAKGPRHPQGRSERASGAGRCAAVTGNEAVGGSQTRKRSPVTSPVVTRMRGVWLFLERQARKENHTRD